MTSPLPPELSPRPTAGTAGAASSPRPPRRWWSVLATVMSAAVFAVSLGGWAMFTHYTGQDRPHPGAHPGVQ